MTRSSGHEMKTDLICLVEKSHFLNGGRVTQLSEELMVCLCVVGLNWSHAEMVLWWGGGAGRCSKYSCSDFLPLAALRVICVRWMVRSHFSTNHYGAARPAPAHVRVLWRSHCSLMCMSNFSLSAMFMSHSMFFSWAGFHSDRQSSHFLWGGTAPPAALMSSYSGRHSAWHHLKHAKFCSVCVSESRTTSCPPWPWSSAQRSKTAGVLVSPQGPGSPRPAADGDVAVEEMAERLAQTEKLVVQLKEMIREKDATLRSKDDQLKVRAPPPSGTVCERHPVVETS